MPNASILVIASISFSLASKISQAKVRQGSRKFMVFLNFTNLEKYRFLFVYTQVEEFILIFYEEDRVKTVRWQNEATLAALTTY